MLEIVRIGLERRDQIAAIWAEAFEPDPLMRWVFPDGAARLESLRRWWGFILDHLPAGAELHGTRVSGCAACWQPPRPDEPAGREEAELRRSGGQAAFVAIMTELLGDLAPSRMAALGQMHQARLSEPHWYLAVLGTAAGQQGRGLGGRVLAPMLDRCDRLGQLAYLESSNPANLGFYRRHGFEPVGEFAVGDGVLITPMTREPRLVRNR
ncbi:MAG: GNAT family N-acetyltransferase [bacterium]|nr:GNAT family N-acetyltransferase [bacterium]MCY4193231.1 GNAT family N-acetyltransferase [bacterium]MCY4271119.1 GNAT family N-acetyltransferase [bacterium]